MSGGQGSGARSGAVAVGVAVDRDGPDEVVWLAAGGLTLGVVPALGGRLLALRVDGRELLYRNDGLIDERLHRRLDVERALPPLDGTLGSWRNYGGDKTWPAPQGWSGPREWAGPPDPVLDSGPYAWSLEPEEGGERAALTMRSAPDARTGLTLTRRIVVEESAQTGFTLELEMENAAASQPVRWALWNVTQVRGAGDPNGGLYVGVDGADAAIRGANAADRGADAAIVPLVSGTGTPAHEQVAPGVVRVPDQDVVGKLGFPGASGWLAYAAGEHVLTQRWTITRDAPYPDEGSRAEAWLEHPLDAPIAHLGDLQPSERIVECEVLGPLVELAPGERASLTIAYAAGPRAGWDPTEEARR